MVINFITPDGDDDMNISYVKATKRHLYLLS